MNQQYKKPWGSIVVLLLSSLYLAGCSNSSTPASASDPNPEPEPEPELVNYDVSVVNLSNNQPLSPLAVIFHDDAFTGWSIGSAASTGLEYIAEGGSNSQLLASLSSDETTSASGEAAIGPGGSEVVSVTVGGVAQSLLTVITMLVNTNDAFTGVQSIDVSELAVGESMTLMAKVYDAGTEINSESLGTIPGPADGGEGFNAARSDISDVVSNHGGVVTADDGLSSSVLDQSHRFDNPAMLITITRL